MTTLTTAAMRMSQPMSAPMSIHITGRHSTAGMIVPRHLSSTVISLKSVGSYPIVMEATTARGGVAPGPPPAPKRKLDRGSPSARFVRLKSSYYRLFHSMIGTDPSSVPVLHTMYRLHGHCTGCMPCEVHVPMLQSMLERRTFYETWSVSGGTLRTVVASVRGSVFERGRLAGGGWSM